jgi:hypothetical protein
MERIGGFMQSHYIARRIGPADAMVIAGLNTTQNTTFS